MKKILPNLNEFKEILKISILFNYPDNDSIITEIKTKLRYNIKNQNLLKIIDEIISIYEAEKSLDTLQELYTLTFDLKPIFYPYLSYHIHYDSFNRNTEMINLRDLYNKYNFHLDKEINELPDHIFIVLKFLEFVNDEKILKEIVENLIFPSLNNYYNSTFKQLKPEFIEKNPYSKLIQYIINSLGIKDGSKDSSNSFDYKSFSNLKNNLLNNGLKRGE